MSDPVVKSAKRLASRPASYSTASKSTAKGSKVAAKTARPKPALKNKAKASAKPPVRKATPAKPAAKKASAAKPSKAAPAKKTVPSKTSGRSAGKARAATSAKSNKKATTVAAKPQARKAAPAAKKPAARPSKPSAAAKALPARPAPPPPRQPTRDEAAALKAFERAHKEFTRGRFAEARTLFRELITKHGGVSEVTARARTYLAIAEARLKSENSIPRDAESLYDRGVIELNRGDYVAAQEMFERALKREPDAADVHYALAATRARLGAVESALQSLERALELKPSLRVRVPHDQDLSLLRNEPEYERLLYTTQRP